MKIVDIECQRCGATVPYWIYKELKFKCPECERKIKVLDIENESS